MSWHTKYLNGDATYGQKYHYHRKRTINAQLHPGIHNKDGETKYEKCDNDKAQSKGIGNEGHDPDNTVPAVVCRPDVQRDCCDGGNHK